MRHISFLENFIKLQKVTTFHPKKERFIYLAAASNFFILYFLINYTLLINEVNLSGFLILISGI